MTDSSLSFPVLIKCKVRIFILETDSRWACNKLKKKTTKKKLKTNSVSRTVLGALQIFTHLTLNNYEVGTFMFHYIDGKNKISHSLVPDHRASKW